VVVVVLVVVVVVVVLVVVVVNVTATCRDEDGVYWSPSRDFGLVVRAMPLPPSVTQWLNDNKVMVVVLLLLLLLLLHVV
jgi:hypothetical protein